ncbi:hypothetical protein RFI_03299 [Reticulomyxa filosa]|uniref:Uncharacterized protein n=1 Tax=Reticulomyxa filosa TaxID=46433 RepID=X6P5H6_RETFI|nr:hypothetical protein RFI_03299 [Reticulomyxa filosa]|eukprot:ETO33805.1 hypothetical protein RFI_03299 [Reticulomyxa filosa]
MLKNGKWRNYEIAFDYEHRTIMLFDENKLKIKSLQLGNPNKSSLEYNVHIQWYNHIDINHTYAKWACFILNHTWHFRTSNSQEREDFSFYYSEFNSFCIIWKDGYNRIYKESLNPYLTTLKQGLQHIKDKIQKRDHLMFGTDELVTFQCLFEEWSPQIESNMGDKNLLLHDIYKHLPHYPTVQIYWKVKQGLIVPYKRTVDIKRVNLPKKGDKKSTFNPFLYECDINKLQIIHDALHFKINGIDELKKLLHEIIKNNYLLIKKNVMIISNNKLVIMKKMMDVK